MIKVSNKLIIAQPQRCKELVTGSINLLVFKKIEYVIGTNQVQLKYGPEMKHKNDVYIL